MQTTESAARLSRLFEQIILSDGITNKDFKLVEQHVAGEMLVDGELTPSVIRPIATTAAAFLARHMLKQHDADGELADREVCECSAVLTYESVVP